MSNRTYITDNTGYQPNQHGQYTSPSTTIPQYAHQLWEQQQIVQRQMLELKDLQEKVTGDIFKTRSTYATEAMKIILNQSWSLNYDGMAEECFKIADAMIAASKKNGVK